MLFLGSGMLTQSEDMEIYTCNSDLTIFFSLYFFIIKGSVVFFQSATTELHCENLLTWDL